VSEWDCGVAGVVERDQRLMQVAGSLVEAKGVQLCTKIAFDTLNAAIQGSIVGRATINLESRLSYGMPPLVAMVSLVPKIL